MANRFMQSTAELCFADRDLLPSYCRKPEVRESYRSNPDTDEAQRYFGSDDDLTYLYSAESRQEYEDRYDDDDLFDDADEGLEEHIICAFADTDDDDVTCDAEQVNCEELHPMREVTRKVPVIPTHEEVMAELRKIWPSPGACLPMPEASSLMALATARAKERNKRNRRFNLITKLVPVRPSLEPIDPEEKALHRQSKVEANEATVRSYNRDERARGGNSKPRRIHDNRQTMRCAELAERDSLDAHRLDKLFSEIAAERKNAKKARHLVAA
ncbi:MAG: hypothetical protein WC551_06320 [Patescibacteria group bacterium]